MLSEVRRRLVRQYRRHVPARVRAAIYRRRPGRAEPNRPLVSIVVPVYGVEDYLAECLDSLVRQTHRNLEIIVVDDESPDESYAIAESFAASDARVKIVRRPNGGLGAARNTGVRAATGAFLSFADADDTIPHDAIASMVASVEQSGSDFVVGAMARMDDERTFTTGWVKEVHAEDRHQLRLQDFPDILKDVFAWNKLFATDFFRRKVGSFPERIRYEDQEPTARAYVAGTFDVLAATVYHWRIRADGTSITQQKSDPADLADRLAVKQRVSHVIAESGSPTYERWLVKAIGFDLRPYFEQVPRTDAAFFQQLRNGMQRLAENMTPKLWQQVPIVDRLPALATLAGYHDDVGVTVTRRAEYGWFVPSRVENNGVFLDRRYLEGMRLSPDDQLLRLNDSDLRVMARATSLWWHGTRLRLTGYAYITNTHFGTDSRVSAQLIAAGRPPVDLATESYSNPRFDYETNDAWNSHSESGFSVDIDPTALRLDANALWRVQISVTCCGVTGSTVLREADVRGIVGTSAVAAANGPRRWMAGAEPNDALLLQCKRGRQVTVSKLQTVDGGVIITIKQPTAATLQLTCRTLRRKIEVPGTSDHDGNTQFDVKLPELSNRNQRNPEHVWSMRLQTDGRSDPLAYPGDRDDLEAQSPEHLRVRAIMTRAGTLRLTQSIWGAVADHVRVTTGSIEISGRIDAPGGHNLRARIAGDTQQFRADRVTFDASKQRFWAQIPFDADLARSIANSPVNTAHSTRAAKQLPHGPSHSSDDRFRPTMLHGFSARLSIQIGGQPRYERWLKTANTLQHRLPADYLAANYGVTLTRTPRAAALWVRFRAPYRQDERGRLAQRRLHDEVDHIRRGNTHTSRPLKDAVVFESFNGRQISDSVLSLCNEMLQRNPKVELYWTVNDLSMPTPPGTTPLLIHSREWANLLHRARFLVNNNNFPFYFRKNPDQVYLQTWHGTPLKQIGNDVPGANLSLSYRQLMQREPRYWDFLLAQNDFAAQTLPNAFGYQGRVLNLGYPRNDVLIAPGAQARRTRARQRFGFSEHQTVVLYAPTWRDNIRQTAGYGPVRHLDFEQLRAALGADTYLLLRGHINTSRNHLVDQSGVIDVTRHSDVNDLLLAADVLITDYSSTMFDFAVTRKPILFLTPDLENYRDVTRGFYFDLEQISPGPICRTNDQLISEISDIPRLRHTYTDRYRRFIELFAPRDDGEASSRVVDTVFNGVVDRSPRLPSGYNRRGTD